jgi:hypothetical protein
MLFSKLLRQLLACAAVAACSGTATPSLTEQMNDPEANLVRDGAVAQVTDAGDAAQLNDASNSVADLFASPSALKMTISAPLSVLFRRVKQGQFDPPIANAGVVAKEYSEPGQLTFDNFGAQKTLQVRVYVRGDTSRTDCPFMKLKLVFDDKQQLVRTPFMGHSKVRLNTHCGPGGVTSRSALGRVLNGVGPVREDLTSRLIRAAGIETYLTRVAAIRYNDTADSARSLDSFGVMLESANDAAQRFAASSPPMIQPNWVKVDDAQAAKVQISPLNSAQIIVAEAIAGNRDWNTGAGVRNLDSFSLPLGGPGFQIAQDFDLSAIALGDTVTYTRGVAPISEAQRGLTNAQLVAMLRLRKAAMLATYRALESAMIQSGAIASTDATTTTDSGYLEARRRIESLFALPELK